MDTQGKFYLGRTYDADLGKTTEQALLYDPEDLTTHAIIVGMTGSGKTGLCIGLMEEAALQGVPALMIDPKGDITNALLHFPDLLPTDFQPWVNPDEARRAGKTLEQAGADAAGLWQRGLAEWGIQPERIRQLKNAAQFAIYTPGSDAGLPVSILASLKAPSIAWEENRETLRERISGTVTGILGLVGLSDIDPVRSREHILLANIFENAWSQGKDLDLGELILQTQNPPFPRLGVFDVNTFFPEKDRFDLAMRLNNILAAPSFQPWLEGQPLDIEGLLYTPDGRPRHSIFTISHLSDAERMFFVTLLFSSVETWMRTQTGTTSLRALLYFDEIFGYLPPSRNPASKQPMLRMLKQARAFGVGLVLATQNPVDVDYKALSNAGTWMIGRLQTDQDKQRLLDGLQGASPGMDRSAVDGMLSNLGKRVFLMHNVHEKKPVAFQTRWAMNYLTGPLTRVQIPALNALAGAALDFSTGARPAVAVEREPTRPRQELVASTPPPAAMGIAGAGAASMPAGMAAPPHQVDASGEASLGTRPALPARVSEYFLPNNLTITQAFKAAEQNLPEAYRPLGLLYRPVLLGQASIRLLNRKYNLDSDKQLSVIVENPDRRGVIRWGDRLTTAIEMSSLDRQPDPRGRFAPLEAPLNDARLITDMQRDFSDWAFHSGEIQVWAHDPLKQYAGPEISQAEFRTRCAESARESRDAEADKLRITYERKLDTLRTKLTREERDLAENESELNQRRMEELGTHAETIFSLFSKRRKSVSSSLSKRRMTSNAQADVEESRDEIEMLKKQIAELEKERDEALNEINERWSDVASQITTITVAPLKKDVRVELFGVAWMPYHLVEVNGQAQELPGYGA